jgi:IS30 family transposase
MSGYPERRMSGETVYNHIFFHMKGELRKLALEGFRRRGEKRSKNSAEKWGKPPEMTLIDRRPPEINARASAGD